MQEKLIRMLNDAAYEHVKLNLGDYEKPGLLIEKRRRFNDCYAYCDYSKYCIGISAKLESIKVVLDVLVHEHIHAWRYWCTKETGHDDKFKKMLKQCGGARFTVLKGKNTLYLCRLPSLQH